MLIDLKRFAAYICPSCSNISTRLITAFNFSNGVLKLLCARHNCCDICASIYEKPSKYFFEIECPLCGDTHSFSVPKSDLWTKPLISYKCPSSGMDIFFIGEYDHVKTALEENIKIYSEITYEDDEIDDEQANILYKIIDCINELRDIHRIECVCDCDNINLTIINNCAVLSCPSCKRTKFIEPTKENLEMIMQADTIILND